MYVCMYSTAGSGYASSPPMLFICCCDQDRPFYLVAQNVVNWHWRCKVKSYSTDLLEKKRACSFPLTKLFSLKSKSAFHCHCCSIMCYNICWHHTPHVGLLVNASKLGFSTTGFKSWFELGAAAEETIFIGSEVTETQWRIPPGCQMKTYNWKSTLLKRVLCHYNKNPHTALADFSFFFSIKGQT